MRYRIFIFLLTAAFFGLAGAFAPPGQAASKRSLPPQIPKVAFGEKVEFRTADGWKLGAWYAPRRDAGLWTFICLHGVGAGKGEWEHFASTAAALGYGILAYDARGHGESQMGPQGRADFRSFQRRGEDNEWNQMTADVEAALVFLSSQGVNSSSTVLVGGSIGANIMLKAASRHPEIPMAILASPSLNYREVRTVNDIRQYGRRPLLLMTSQNDEYSFSGAKLLYNLGVFSTGRQVSFLAAIDGHGAPLLEGENLEKVMRWVQNPSKSFMIVVSTISAAPEPQRSPPPGGSR
ncbi:MAG: hypothetical protein A3G41_01100 [Elusimicrobia bacterium RIFCSPLOWO2_12_FULL_59_9]|nr:MAG: hypothetical protein A3G41_01100 [Elusimicrobia bacterium RIFCSPLOWO2_12_FULL_59_9]